MGVREMFLISPQDLSRLQAKEVINEPQKSPIDTSDGEVVAEEISPQTNNQTVTQSDGSLELLELALEGVNPRYKKPAFQLLKHLSFVNQTSDRFKFDSSDFGIIVDGRKVPKSNLVEIINTAFKRGGPVGTDILLEREKHRLQIPGFFTFLRLLGSIGIPSSMFPNPLVSDYVRKSRH
jgi:archaellum component FlaG (FlaF/FlaG flagellin family)